MNIQKRENVPNVKKDISRKVKYHVLIVIKKITLWNVSQMKINVLQCEYNYYPTGTECKYWNSQHCKYSDSKNGTYSSCLDGYYLKETEQCDKITEKKKIQHCEESVDGKICIDCKERCVLYQKQCHILNCNGKISPSICKYTISNVTTCGNTKEGCLYGNYTGKLIWKKKNIICVM